jgi:hypothetical protein
MATIVFSETENLEHLSQLVTQIRSYALNGSRENQRTRTVTCYFYGRTKIVKFGRNPGDFVAYIRKGISEGLTEVSTRMSEITWLVNW